MFQQLWGVVTATKDEMLILRRDFTKMQSSNSIIQSMKARIDKLDKSMGNKLENAITKSAEQERILNCVFVCERIDFNHTWPF